MILEDKSTLVSVAPSGSITTPQSFDLAPFLVNGPRGRR
jgi:hypothetical protein